MRIKNPLTIVKQEASSSKQIKAELSYKIGQAYTMTQLEVPKKEITVGFLAEEGFVYNLGAVEVPNIKESSAEISSVPGQKYIMSTIEVPNIKESTGSFTSISGNKYEFNPIEIPKLKESTGNLTTE